MNAVYDPLLVALSIAIAILASYTALDLARSVTLARGRARHLWLVAGSLAMGAGIWSMHFVGMLAAHVHGVTMAYDVPLLIVSVLAAFVGSALALYTVSRSSPTTVSLAVGGLAMGAAIAGMHYLGMASMRMEATLVWNVPLVVLSLVIAAASAFAALWMAFRFRAEESPAGVRHRLLGGTLMGIAISGMHYTAMAACTFVPTGRAMAVTEHQLLATSGLAVAVTGSTVMLLCLALVGSAVNRAFELKTRASEEAAHLYRVSEQARAEAERRARDEAALRALARTLVAPHAMGDMLEQIIENARVSSGADGAFLERINDARTEVEIVVRAGWGGPDVGRKLPFPGSLTEAAIESGEPELVADLVAETQRPIARELEATCGHCAAMVVPLLSDRRAMGGIVLLRRPDQPPFTGWDLVRTGILGDLAALALDRAERDQERAELL
ncbi:MAG: MHYT domain-containing protein, partial [Myxococcales bacterium]